VAQWVSVGWRLFALLTVACVACDGTVADGPLCLDDCELCGEQGCPDDRCGILYILAKNCEGKVETLEVAVDQCLEPEEVTLEMGVIGCKTLKEGESGTIAARSENWAWLEDVTCTSQHMGTVIPVSFYCTSQSDE